MTDASDRISRAMALADGNRLRAASLLDRWAGVLRANDPALAEGLARAARGMYRRERNQAPSTVPTRLRYKASRLRKYGIALFALLLCSCANPCGWHEETWKLPDAPAEDGTCWGVRAFRGSGFDYPVSCPTDSDDGDCWLMSAGYQPPEVHYYVRDEESPDPPQLLLDVPCSIKSCAEMDAWALGSPGVHN